MLNLSTLGAVEVVGIGDARPIPLEPKRLALLIYVALSHGGRAISRDVILPVFWPELGEQAARSALRQALHYLVRKLGPVFDGRGTNEIAVDAERLQADAPLFELALDDHLSARAMRLYRGEFLSGFSFPTASDAFLEWADRERLRLMERALEATIQLADEERERGNETGRIHWLKRALDLEPFREDLLEEIVAIYQRAGQPATAVHAIRAFSRNLRLRYGVPLSPRIRQLLRALTNAADPAVRENDLHRFESIQGQVASEVARTAALIRQLQALNPLMRQNGGLPRETDEVPWRPDADRVKGGR